MSTDSTSIPTSTKPLWFSPDLTRNIVNTVSGPLSSLSLKTQYYTFIANLENIDIKEYVDAINFTMDDGQQVAQQEHQSEALNVMRQKVVRQLHFDRLVKKIYEERIKRILLPMIATNSSDEWLLKEAQKIREESEKLIPKEGTYNPGLADTDIIEKPCVEIYQKVRLIELGKREEYTCVRIKEDTCERILQAAERANKAAGMTELMRKGLTDLARVAVTRVYTIDENTVEIVGKKCDKIIATFDQTSQPFVPSIRNACK